jgi:hypothetical protein
MDARFARATCVVAALIVSMGAGFRTQNFVIDAPTVPLAQEIGHAAEKLRRELAMEWLGKEMPAWGQACMLSARVAPHLGAGGATSFVFENGEVFGWQMTIQGSRERILDSVLPHEITHTVFACHFRQALPRWADEGACTTVEHVSEKNKQQEMLITFLKTGRGISFSQMFAMKDYPQDVMPLYSQGYSLARYLIAQGGKQKFLAFVGTGLQDENWPAALQQHYDVDSLLTLQNTWLDWVRQGSPRIDNPAASQVLVASDLRRQSPGSDLIYRAQNEDAPSAYSNEPGTRLVPVVRPAKASPAPDTRGWKPAGTSAYASDATSPAELTRPEPLRQQSARQLPPEKSRQIILEWERQPGEPPRTARGPLLDASLGGVMRR